jgi:glucan phosphoethanolaminetransferase (alkaline phosphatase superfamily)
MIRFNFKFIVIAVSSLLICAFAQAQDHHSVTEKEKAAIAKMQERMNKNTHRAKYNAKKIQKSALKKSSDKEQ